MEQGAERSLIAASNKDLGANLCSIVITDGGAGYKQPKFLLVTLLNSLSRWSCCYQFLMTWRKNENCDQRYLTNTVKTGTYKLSDNILRNWGFFYSKTIDDVRAVNNNTSELETIWKLNMSLTLNGRVRRAIFRKEKNCEKWNFSPVISMTSSAIPKS